MRRTAIWAGAAAGAVNGIFGGGGGMVFITAAGRALPQRKLYATSLAVMFPVCAVSASVYVLRGGVSLREALPYLAGGLAGGITGGKLYGRVSPDLLRRIFAAFLLYAGVRYLFW